MPGRDIGGVEVQLYSFLTSAFDEVGWSKLCPCRFTPRKRPGSHFTGGMVVLGTGLDRRGQSRTHRGSNPKPPIL